MFKRFALDVRVPVATWWRRDLREEGDEDGAIEEWIAGTGVREVSRGRWTALFSEQRDREEEEAKQELFEFFEFFFE